MSKKTLTFEELNSLSHGKIHEMTYRESDFVEWDKASLDYENDCMIIDIHECIA